MKGNMASAGEALMFFCKCTVFLFVVGRLADFFRQGMSALHLPFLKGHFLRGYGDTVISYEFHFQEPRILMKKKGTLDRATGANAYRKSPTPLPDLVA
jgi:hypothetical protein